MSFMSVTPKDWIMIIQVLITIFVARFYYKYFTRPSPLPGPFPLPLVGNLFRVGLNPAKYAMDHRKEFGDMFEIWVGSRRFIILSHPSLVDQIYLPSVKSKFFKRMHFPKLEKAGMHHGLIFNDDYPIWKRNRKFVVQSLMSPRFLRRFTHLVQSLFNENESFWDKNEYHVDLAKWVKCFTTDITLQTVSRKPTYCLHTYLFGEEHSDPIKSKEIQRSVKLSNAIQTFIPYLIFQTFIPDTLKDYVPGFYNLNKKYEKNTNWINETILDFIKERRVEIEKLPNDGKVGSDLIDVLLTLNTSLDPNRDEDEAPLNDQEIRSTIMEVCIAGMDTTGNAFCYAVWQLAHHPKVLARFQEEIGKVLGDDTLRQITYEDLERFTYLDAILKESQRIIPITPLMGRTSTQDSVIGGKHWEADTIFLINHEQIHLSSDCWKDPDQFIPERFLKESDHEIVKNSYLPFGGGIRICPGRHMATVELKTLLILLFRKYDVELVDKVSKKPKIKYIGVNNCTEMKVIVRPKKRLDA